MPTHLLKAAPLDSPGPAGTLAREAPASPSSKELCSRSQSQTWAPCLIGLPGWQETLQESGFTARVVSPRCLSCAWVMTSPTWHSALGCRIAELNWALGALRGRCDSIFRAKLRCPARSVETEAPGAAGDGLASRSCSQRPCAGPPAGTQSRCPLNSRKKGRDRPPRH